QRVDAGHRPADDQFLDLRGALVQRGHAHVAEIALDRVVIDVAGAPCTWMAAFAHSTAASVACSLATEVSSVFGRPRSLSQPARHTSMREASVLSTMSAIIAWIS